MRNMGFIILICFFISCQSTESVRPSRSQREHFVRAYVAILILQHNYFNQTAVIQDSTEKILEMHQLTQNDIEKIITYYDEKPRRWNRFFSKALELLESEYKTVPSVPDSLPKAHLLINKSSEAVRR